jgi:hypothetical protein
MWVFEASAAAEKTAKKNRCVEDGLIRPSTEALLATAWLGQLLQ